MNTKPSRPGVIVANFASTPQTVFDAWINPEIIRHWMFATPTNRVGVIGVDPTPGGRFAILTWEGEDQAYHVGEYLTVETPRCLAFTLEAPARFDGQARATMYIEPRGAGSVMTFSHVGMSGAMTDGDWRTMFGNLKKLLGAPRRRAAPAPSFADTEVAEHHIENLVHLDPARQSPQRPGRQA